MRKLNYFPNAKGDYTITLDNEPICFVKTSEHAKAIYHPCRTLSMLCDNIDRELKAWEKQRLKAVAMEDSSSRAVMLNFVDGNIRALKDVKEFLDRHKEVRDDE